LLRHDDFAGSLDRHAPVLLAHRAAISEDAPSTPHVSTSVGTSSPPTSLSCRPSRRLPAVDEGRTVTTTPMDDDIPALIPHPFPCDDIELALPAGAGSLMSIKKPARLLRGHRHGALQ
jgi:hypothetical protein